jgi:septum formation protein
MTAASPATAPTLCDESAKVILASGSGTRAAMLRAAGLAFTVERPAVDEEEAKLSLRAEKATAAATAETLAELKALRVSARHRGAFVIGADQVLDCGGEIFDKPRGVSEALAQLKRLRGKNHHLVSAAVVAKDGGRVWHHADRADLTMRACSDDFLERYLQAVGDAALTSVGCYQVEGFGIQLFSEIRGDHFTILGLPLLPLLGFLRDNGIVPQ